MLGEQMGHLRSWDGFAEQESLSLIRAVLKRRCGLRLGFYALGRH